MVLLMFILGIAIAARTGRILPTTFICWFMLSLQSLVLSEAGALLAQAQDPNCTAFPEGLEFIGDILVVGWLFGLLAAGIGVLVRKLWQSRRTR